MAKRKTKTKTTKDPVVRWGWQLHGKAKLVYRVVQRIAGRGRARYESLVVPAALRTMAVPQVWSYTPDGSPVFAFYNQLGAQSFMAQLGRGELWLAEAQSLKYADRLVLQSGEPYGVRGLDGSWEPQVSVLSEQTVGEYWRGLHRTSHDLVPPPPHTVLVWGLKLLERLEVADKGDE